MPLKSEAQRRWLLQNRPGLLKEFEQRTPSGVKLPEHVLPKTFPKPKHLSKAQPKHKHLSKAPHRPQSR